MYRCYCEGYDFGSDYRTKEQARDAIKKYKSHFPNRKYYIRKFK